MRGHRLRRSAVLTGSAPLEKTVRSIQETKAAMNPLEWERKHQIALILAAIVGAALGVVLGYFVFAAGGGRRAKPELFLLD